VDLITTKSIAIEITSHRGCGGGGGGGVCGGGGERGGERPPDSRKEREKKRENALASHTGTLRMFK